MRERASLPNNVEDAVGRWAKNSLRKVRGWLNFTLLSINSIWLSLNFTWLSSRRQEQDWLHLADQMYLHYHPAEELILVNPTIAQEFLPYSERGVWTAQRIRTFETVFQLFVSPHQIFQGTPAIPNC